MTIIRNYNEESLDNSDRQYAYNFDFDVMHHFMMKSFQPFFKKGNVLELGSYQGDFTTRLLSNFDDITCVEGSDKAIEKAKKKLYNVHGSPPQFTHRGAQWPEAQRVR